MSKERTVSEFHTDRVTVATILSACLHTSTYYSNDDKHDRLENIRSRWFI